VQKLKSVGDLFEADGSLKAVFDREDVYAWFQRRHVKGNRLIDEDGWYRRNGSEWHVPYGVRVALHERLLWTQMVNKYPFFVTWVSPSTGKRLRKNFMSLPSAMVFVAEQAQYVDADAAIVCKNGFNIPRKLMGKFPRRMGKAQKLHYWCPRCMQPRRFRRTGEETHAMKKFPGSYGYEWKLVKLAVVECVVCSITNRDAKFRRSNQPVELRRFKKGVTRARRRRATRRRRR
jgi:hypothetical protein